MLPQRLPNIGEHKYISRLLLLRALSSTLFYPASSWAEALATKVMSRCALVSYPVDLLMRGPESAPGDR